MKSKTVKLALDTLKEKFFVRVHLNQDHVLHLAGLIENGVELPALLVADDGGTYENGLVDGRHRKAAYQFLNIKEAECELRKFGSLSEMILTALQMNVGGALPPGASDISHTMELLLAADMSRKDIIAHTSKMAGFPEKLVQKHLDEVQSRMAKVRLNAAVKSVTINGMTVHEAAAKHGVKLIALQKHLQPTEEEENKGATNIPQLKAWLGRRFGSHNMSIAQGLSKLTHDLKDGITKPEEAAEVLEHLEKLAERQSQFFSNWMTRLGASKSVKEEVAKKPTKRQKKDTRVSKNALERMGLA